MKTYHLLISGKVQGVFYRASAKKEALKIGVNGWIRNTLTGSVEVVITADATSAGAFITWCKSGPKDSDVENVDVTQIDLLKFEGFEIRR